MFHKVIKVLFLAISAILMTTSVNAADKIEMPTQHPSMLSAEKEIPENLKPLLAGLSERVKGIMIEALVDDKSGKQDQLINVFR